MPHAPDIRTFIETYTEDEALHSRYHGFPISEADEAARLRFLEATRVALGSIAVAPNDADAAIDKVLMTQHLELECRRLDARVRERLETAPFVPFADTVTSLREALRAMEDPDPARAAEQVAAIPERIEEGRKRIVAMLTECGGKAGHGIAVTALRTARLTESLAAGLAHWFGFRNGYDPQFRWWLEKPYAGAKEALEGYTRFLRREVCGIGDGPAAPVVGSPIGRDALVAELAAAMITESPEDLIRLGERELARCEDEMKRAAADMGLGTDVKAALERVKNDYVAPGDQPALVRDLAREAIAFVEERDLVTVPEAAKAFWRMEMMPADRQKVNPFFTGGEVICVSYPTDTMEHGFKRMSLRGNNRHFARATVHHELIPGHHLQLYMGSRHKPYRRLFSTPFLSEGWCLHWEMLLWDLGFARSPENRIGMLFWRMHRCARIVFSLGFHLGSLTPEACTRLLVDRVGFEPANAEAEVRRSFEGGYPPLYQCAYMLGGLQVRALHRELVGSGHMSHREFHDAVLRENAIPVELIRARLTGTSPDALSPGLLSRETS